MTKYFLHSVSLLLLLTAQQSLACQQLVMNETFPISTLEQHETIVLAKILDVDENSKSRYGEFTSFSATVQETLKGSVAAGTTISAQPSDEAARIACPARLTEGVTYLLLLGKSNNQYHLSRFSFTVNHEHKYYLEYIKQIKAAIK